MDRNKRSGSDRRKQTGINVRTIIGDGSRTTVRRQEDHSHLFLVGRYSPALFMAILSILFLSALDALLTVFLLNHGAYETNPLMAYLLNFGPYTFFVSKYALTMFGIFNLLIFRSVVIRKFNLTTHSFLYLAAWIYVAVIGWELYLVYRFV